MVRRWQLLKQWMRLLWRGLREWSGDAAYDQYLVCARRRSRNKLLSPTEFYVEQLDRKYSRPNRCC